MKKIIISLSLVAILLISGICAANEIGDRIEQRLEEVERYKPIDPENMVDTSQYKKEPPYKIGFSNASTSNSFGVIFYKTARWEAEQWSDIADFYWTDAQDSSSKQISDCEDLLARGIDLLIVRPCTADSLGIILDKAERLGVPVVISNRPVSMENYVTLVGTKMEDIGRSITNYMVEQLDGEGNIISFEGTPGSGAAVGRWEATKEILADYPDIEILARASSKWSRADAKSQMENFLQTFDPDEIDGILSQSGIMSTGVVEAIEEAGLDPKDFVITGDNYNGWNKWMKENNHGMGTTNATWCSGASIVAGFKILNGEPVPKFWDNGSIEYTSENVDEYLNPDEPDTWWSNVLPEEEVKETLEEE